MSRLSENCVKAGKSNFNSFLTLFRISSPRQCRKPLNYGIRTKNGPSDCTKLTYHKTMSYKTPKKSEKMARGKRSNVPCSSKFESLKIQSFVSQQITKQTIKGLIRPSSQFPGRSLDPCLFGQKARERFEARIVVYWLLGVHALDSSSSTVAI